MEGSGVDLGLLVIRVLVGVAFSLHGMQKLFGWFDGGGLAGTASWFRSLGFGDGRLAARMAGASEVTGGLGLALGLVTPLAAAAMIGTMTVAALVNNQANGFWSAKKGWELNYHLIVVALGVAVAGPGRWSLDAALGLGDLLPIPMSGPGAGLIAIVLGAGGGLVQWTQRTSS